MLLNDIKSPGDLKGIAPEKLPVLAKEMREKIIEVVSHNGGHLASNLGVVELSIALHRVFSSPEDAIVWDVSHQCYPHKILTGRYAEFSSIRKKDGISGFTRIYESPHDYFDAGHASSSISSALGLLAAWKSQGRNDRVVAVIGDGALTGGLAFEGLAHAGHLSKNLVVILNDNKMSIDRNVGSVSSYLSRLTMSGTYQSFRRNFDRIVDRIPYFNRHLNKMIFRLKRGLKGIFLTDNLFVDLGFDYVGPLDGHNMEQLEMVLSKVKKIPRPVVVHVVTKKGKGYSPAENNPSAFHGVGPFSTSDGIVEKYDSLSFTEAFSKKIISLAERDGRIMGITAAMSKGTGLDAFSRKFKDRFFDVGIAEEHAVTFAGGLACGGAVPVVAIYSTFMQRSVDQVIEDVALPDRHVIMVLDRAGAVPQDGETHQGIFDIALFRNIPNMTMISVATEKDLDVCLEWAAEENKGPVIIRWPKLSCPSELPQFSGKVVPGCGVFVPADEFDPALCERISGDSDKVLLVCTGGIFSETLTASRSLLRQDIRADIYSLRFIKPFDEDHFVSIAEQYRKIVVVEDGVRAGGIGELIEKTVLRRLPSSGIVHMAFPDKFLSNGTRSQILEEAGLSPEKIAEAVKNDF